MSSVLDQHRKNVSRDVYASLNWIKCRSAFRTLVGRSGIQTGDGSRM